MKTIKFILTGYCVSVLLRKAIYKKNIKETIIQPCSKVDRHLSNQSNFPTSPHEFSGEYSLNKFSV